MSTNFECFVTISGNKHTINLEKDINKVTFGDVYQKIQKLDPKQDISYERYVFECFDFDINSFKRIVSTHQLIKYFSRIRVLTKTQNQSNYY